MSAKTQTEKILGLAQNILVELSPYYKELVNPYDNNMLSYDDGNIKIMCDRFDASSVIVEKYGVSVSTIGVVGEQEKIYRLYDELSYVAWSVFDSATRLDNEENYTDRDWIKLILSQTDSTKMVFEKISGEVVTKHATLKMSVIPEENRPKKRWTDTQIKDLESVFKILHSNLENIRFYSISDGGWRSAKVAKIRSVGNTDFS